MHGCILKDPMELRVWDFELFYLADLVGLCSASKSGHQTSLWTSQGNLKNFLIPEQLECFSGATAK